MHGDVKAVRKVIDYAYKTPSMRIIFLGDFLDSFNHSIDDQVASLELAMEQAQCGMADIIIGNHEASYFVRDQECSGYSHTTQLMVNRLRNQYHHIVRSHIRLGSDVLVTHAGLPLNYFPNITDIDQLDGYLSLAYSLDSSVFFRAGRSRGGWFPVGGPVWCDWNDEFIPIPGIRQVVGHTATEIDMPKYFKQYKVGLLRTNINGDWNVDCLTRGHEFLTYDIETDEFDRVVL